MKLVCGKDNKFKIVVSDDGENSWVVDSLIAKKPTDWSSDDTAITLARTEEVSVDMWGGFPRSDCSGFSQIRALYSISCYEKR